MDKADRQFTPLERIFSVITSIRPGEGKSAAILTLQSFLTLLCYSLIRPVKEAIILAQEGAEVRSYATGVQTLLLLVLIPLYSAWYRKKTGSGMIQNLNLFFALNLLIFYVAIISGYQVGIVFYIWVAIFNVMVIAQFWAFTADLYNVKSGQRLFVIIMLGASVGGLVGSRLAVVLFPLIHEHGLILLAMSILLLTLFLSNLAQKRIPAESKRNATRDDVAPQSGIMGGFSLISRDTYLILIATFAVFLNWIGTNGDYIISKFVMLWAEEQVALGSAQSIVSLTGTFYASYIFWINLLSFLLQSCLVSRLFKWIGIRGTILILPIVMAITYGLIFIIPVFSIFKWAKTVEMGTNYSIANTARHALFLPVSREEKYEAKMAIDTFFWRFGDLFSTATVFIGFAFLDFSVTEFVVINFVLSICLLLIAIKIGQFHQQKVIMNVTNEAPIAINPVKDLSVNPGESFVYMIHKQTFHDPDPGDALRFTACLIDGSPIPKWLNFIALECCFSGNPPEEIDLDLELEILITATDYDGLSAETCFKILVQPAAEAS
ncbi:MAG: ATP translocase [Gammaproteobacteria bacterium]|nr:MAG: ATP translocase [Gammaproteobacteria bacterium]